MDAVPATIVDAARHCKLDYRKLDKKKNLIYQYLKSSNVA